MPQPPAAWDDPFVPIRPIADTTGRPIQTIYRWVRTGVVRHQRAPDGHILIAIDDYLVASETRTWRNHLPTPNRLDNVSAADDPAQKQVRPPVSPPALAGFARSVEVPRG